MSRPCNILDSQLMAFSTGDEQHLDEHIETCDECQAFLAELWEDELPRDLVEPVVQYLRMELFLIDVAKTSGGIAARMAKAMLKYLDNALAGEDR